MHRPARTLLSLLLALSLLGGWTAQAVGACGGVCCGAEAAAPRPVGHERPLSMVLSSSCGCCGEAAPPCDLTRSELPDPPPRALSAAPKVEDPAVGLLAVHPLASAPTRVATGLRRFGTDPPDRAPPTPRYLLHLAFLC